MDHDLYDEFGNYKTRNRKFSTTPPQSSAQRSFVELILVPMYKIFAVGEMDTCLPERILDV